MNVIRPEKIDSIDEDENLAAVTEVEAGIRDFVRNDVAYLRRRRRASWAAPRGRWSRTPGHRQQRQLADPARRRPRSRKIET